MSSINNHYTFTTTSFGTASDVVETLSFTSSNRNLSLLVVNNTSTVATTSRVVVGSHGIQIWPWQHLDLQEVMKAHKIIEVV
ncbi:hypothetical protein Ccrd_024793 [Cynara cardunculus var. scolymus]|uniref:Uncharacterized protein n=1 Tax=Cynara cardunculus var. scolymus TaxID=59895 RepID=A0A103XBX7_CYNCS|nr:hypothetical protein Ccrd_024793 [Cynara cardunculus var. scolymus]